MVWVMNKIYIYTYVHIYSVREMSRRKVPGCRLGVGVICASSENFKYIHIYIYRVSIYFESAGEE